MFHDTTETKSDPAKEPTHIAYCVRERHDANRCTQIRIGEARQRPDGTLDIQLEASPIDGRFRLCLAADEEQVRIRENRLRVVPNELMRTRRVAPNEIASPWTLHFDRDGTEDVAFICDNQGYDLAASRFFWLPEGNDPVPPTLAAFRLMVRAPELLDALYYLLEATVESDLDQGNLLNERQTAARNKALAVIASVKEN
jgi:hypothetical protein